MKDCVRSARTCRLWTNGMNFLLPNWASGGQGQPKMTDTTCLCPGGLRPVRVRTHATRKALRARLHTQGFNGHSRPMLTVREIELSIFGLINGFIPGSSRNQPWFSGSWPRQPLLEIRGDIRFMSRFLSRYTRPGEAVWSWNHREMRRQPLRCPPPEGNGPHTRKTREKHPLSRPSPH